MTLIDPLAYKRKALRFGGLAVAFAAGAGNRLLRRAMEQGPD